MLSPVASSLSRMALRSGPAAHVPVDEQSSAAAFALQRTRKMNLSSPTAIAFDVEDGIVHQRFGLKLAAQPDASPPAKVIAGTSSKREGPSGGDINSCMLVH
mmetsp:Transcript_58783/g.140117  ORF Transcript_58783/g.140117 Transcript_58783/m.140117 type:complete len:102 (+) Transcript_58783:1681-1986(+)